MEDIPPVGDRGYGCEEAVDRHSRDDVLGLIGLVGLWRGWIAISSSNLWGGADGRSLHRTALPSHIPVNREFDREFGRISPADADKTRCLSQFCRFLSFGNRE